MKVVVAALLTLGVLACGGGPSAECKQYVACLSAVHPDQKPTVEASYGPGNNVCWASTAQNAELCTSQCRTALESLATQFPDKTECQ